MSKKDELWEKFIESGNILDYIDFYEYSVENPSDEDIKNALSDSRNSNP